MNVNFMPYEGEKPYIFTSYSHRDSIQVIPVLNMLNLMKYRVWYDAGIAAGSVWTDSIANHILNSSVFLAFHSHWSTESIYCHREIEFAISKRKQIVPVWLEYVPLPPGLELMLNPIQHFTLEQFVDCFDKEKIFIDCQESNLTSASPENQLISLNTVPPKDTNSSNDTGELTDIWDWDD